MFPLARLAESSNNSFEAPTDTASHPLKFDLGKILSSLSNVLNHPRFPDDLGVGVEFQLPKTSKRIDVLLTGFNQHHLPVVFIVELKQWATAEPTTMDGVVRTFVGGGFETCRILLIKHGRMRSYCVILHWWLANIR